MDNSLPTPPIQLSENAFSELKSILMEVIGVDATNRLTKAEINHIGCYLLTLTATQLDIRIKEYKNSMDSL